MKTSIFDIENWREIGATLARNKTRTFLTAFGIFWGTAMLAMLWGGARGFEGVMRRNFAGLSTNLAGVVPDSRTVSYKGFNKGTRWSLTTEDIEVIRKLAPAIESSSEVNNWGGTVAYGSKSTSDINLIGVESTYADIMAPVIHEGRFINNSDVNNQRKVMVLGKNVATTLFGNDSPVGKYVKSNGMYFLVIGVASQLSDASIGGNITDGVVVPSSTLRGVYHSGNKVDFFVFTAPPGRSPMENKTVIKRILSSAHSISPDDDGAIFFIDAAEMFEMIDNVFTGIQLLAFFVGLGSLFAGVIGVGNIMWIVVKERTHEFGIRRAIGAKPRDITVQVLSESIVLTLIAGVSGVCFATLVLGIADHVTYNELLGNAGFALPFKAALMIVGAFFILGSLAGTLPAIKAMKIKPIEAINDK